MTSLFLNASHLNAVCNFKYLGNILSRFTADNDDVVYQISLLYPRSNIIVVAKPVNAADMLSYVFLGVN